MARVQSLRREVAGAAMDEMEGGDFDNEVRNILGDKCESFGDEASSSMASGGVGSPVNLSAQFSANRTAAPTTPILMAPMSLSDFSPPQDR